MEFMLLSPNHLITYFVDSCLLLSFRRFSVCLLSYLVFLINLWLSIFWYFQMSNVHYLWLFRICFVEKTKLPCHVVNQRVLFLHSSTTTVCIHSKTSKETIEVTVHQKANQTLNWNNYAQKCLHSNPIPIHIITSGM